KVRANVNIKNYKLTAGLLPCDEVDLTESFSINEHLVRRNEHRFSDVWVRNRETSDRAIEIDHARLSHQNVDGNRLLVLIERRLVGVFLRVPDGGSKNCNQGRQY